VTADVPDLRERYMDALKVQQLEHMERSLEYCRRTLDLGNRWRGSGSAGRTGAARLFHPAGPRHAGPEVVNMRRLALVVLASFSPCLAPAVTPTADELLAAMDEVLQFDTRTSTATMEVIDARRTRSYKMKTYARGQDDAAVLYLEPAREKGTKMLRKEDNLWLYMPRAERVQKISGHMLRQGMMGSDMSYEDMLEAADFEERYEAEVIGEEETAGRPCWKLEARARDDSVSYPRRLIWIDKQNMMPLRQELFALSGMMLKTWIMSEIEMVSGRPVARRMEISDQLKQDSRTVFLLEEISFGVELESEIFTRRWLERK
jgi:outer membrane lipoprotein-sorting protein